MTIKLKPLADQVLVITGASSGIGLVTAKTAAARGAKVLLVARSGDELADAVRDITDAGGTADHFVADVADPRAMRAAAEHAIQRFGRIDSWVNNAGSAIYSKLVDTPEDEHQRLFQTNYFGVVHGAMAAIPELKKRGGALITVGSIASEIASPIMSAYAASKHAVAGYVRALRTELRDDAPDISVTLIMPAGIDTPIAEHAEVHGGGKALLPAPLYDPQIVADAILDAAEHPRRELTVGGAGRAQVLFATHFPRVVELLAPRKAKALTDPTREQPRPSNLFQSVDAGRERSKDQRGRSFSLYTTAAEHPKTTMAVSLGALVGGAALLLFNRDRR